MASRHNSSMSNSRSFYPRSQVPLNSLSTPRSRRQRDEDADFELGYSPGMPLERYPRVDFSPDEDDPCRGSFTPRNASHLPYAMDVPNCRHEPLDIKAMLQEQQATLTKILETQGQFQKKQDSLELKLKEVEELISVTKEVTPSSSSTDSSSKRKRIVSLALSANVSKIHSASELQFKPDESSFSDHNTSVRNNIIKEVCGQPDNVFSEDVVKVAVKRCYETCRRNFLEEQEGKEEFVEMQSKKRKYRSRRQRTFEKRSSVVTAGEMKKWQSLSYKYMTELSDDPDDPNTFIEHPLPWRSQSVFSTGLNDYIKVLDKRVEDKHKKELSGAVSKKVRTIGSPSTQRKPSGPAWAVTDLSVADCSSLPMLADVTNRQTE